MKKKLVGIAVITFFMSNFGYASMANQSQPPLFCKLNQVVVKNKMVYFNKIKPMKAPQVYLIKNTSPFTLSVDHIKSNAGAGAGWASSIAPHHWSAIAVSEKNFNLRCSANANGKIRVVSCAHLQVCQPSRAGLTIQSEGNYWVAEDQTWPQLVEILKEKGVTSVGMK